MTTAEPPTMTESIHDVAHPAISGVGKQDKGTVHRRRLVVGLALATMCISGVLVAGGCSGAAWPANGKLPERVVDRLTECGKRGPKPLESVSYDLSFAVHATEDGGEIRVDEVMLTGSTLHLEEVERCMSEALYGMRAPVDLLALRQHRSPLDPTITPEARVLFGQVEAALFLEAGAAIVVGFAAYYLIVHVIMDKPAKRPRAHIAEPTPEAPPAAPPVVVSVVPTATAAPTITAAPTASPAPPGQSCTDMYVDCREKGPPCNQKLGHKTMCAYCQDNCLADEPYKFKQCRQCGFR